MGCCSITGGSGSPSGINLGGYPTRPPIRPTKPLTPRPIPLYPVTTSTVRPTTHITSSPDILTNSTNGFETIGTIDNNFIQDDDGTSRYLIFIKMILFLFLFIIIDLTFCFTQISR